MLDVVCSEEQIVEESFGTGRRRVKPDPEAVLAFSHAGVIRELEKLGYLPNNARALFLDLLRFLYVAATAGLPQAVPSAEIDVAWHKLLLHTRDYREFCTKYLGRFVDHVCVAGNNDVMHLLAFEATKAEVQRVFGELSPSWSRPGMAKCGGDVTGGGCN